MDIKKIESVYATYGFEIKRDEENLAIFLYKKGRYFGVDIILFSNSKETQDRASQIKEQYSKLGYAVNIKPGSSEEDIELELFKSFFSYESTKNRLKKKYTDFVAKQTKSLLGSQYEYIGSPFELFDGDIGDTSNDLLKNVLTILQRPKPQLIILEAAAGYGKTCAAYEILSILLNQDEKIISPLFTELAKNRGAKIFRYILLDEIDVEFPTLNSELVINEIKKGRIPLIIDGFDELLEKVNVSNIDIFKGFEEIESMLDTIGSLLEHNAKVILTTRKTAIFNGSEFEKWFLKWEDRFSVSRFSIKEPKIKDWLGQHRFGIAKNRNIPIQYIANPVLLTYLKNISEDEFITQIENPELLIKQYFDRMLEREQERQHLIITVEKQYEIFKNVAKMLLEFDITVESKEFFKEIIKDQNYKLLEYTRTLYSGQEKPSLDNLVDTLATHALLDRKGRDESQIGFINDFVFGILIGEIICETSVDIIARDYSFYMLDLACTAYKVQNKQNKFSLWGKINDVKEKLQPVSIFNYDIILREELVRNYQELTIYDTTFFKIKFKDFEVKNTIFLSCYFKNCYFDLDILKGVGFVDCIFDACLVSNDLYIDSSPEISTVKCKLKDCQIFENYTYHNDQTSLFTEFEAEILRKVMEISDARSQHIMHLLHRFDKSQHKSVMRSIDGLVQRDFMKIRGGQVGLNINKLPIIKAEILK
ncbi:hypothetical protein GCM10023091_32040 [Ravibacter arvi]|uniref:NACHT-associated inactive Restriction Endonuclease 2 domain-containing protein n=1 Tax=Ravibacter arvi TaxID=2051041 RepID=A0ABP8M3F5_9BACT